MRKKVTTRDAVMSRAAAKLAARMTRRDRPLCWRYGGKIKDVSTTSIQAQICDLCIETLADWRERDRFGYRLRAFLRVLASPPDGKALMWIGPVGIDARRSGGALSIYAGLSGRVFRLILRRSA